MRSPVPTLLFAAVLALAGCGGREDSPYVVPPATVEWSAASYSMPVGADSIVVELRLWWEADPAETGMSWTRVEALGWESGGAPYPALMMQGFTPPCAPCTKSYVIERRDAGTWTYRARFDAFGAYGLAPSTAEMVVLVE